MLFIHPDLFEEKIRLVVESKILHIVLVRLKEGIARHIYPIEIVGNQALYIGIPFLCTPPALPCLRGRARWTNATRSDVV
jgi:hypothetical protein